MDSEDMEILDDMIIALVDLLVEKGILTHEEYDTKVRELLDESAKLTKFDDLKK